MPVKELAYKVENFGMEVQKARGIEKIIYEGLSENGILTEDHIWALTVLDDLMCLLKDRAEILTNEAFDVWYSMMEEVGKSGKDR